MPQMRLERGPYVGPQVRFQPREVFDGLRGQNYLERHSGQIIAKLASRQIKRRPVRAAVEQKKLKVAGGIYRLKDGRVDMVA
jgi:FPC/CPF motif-containing protein YcgG